MHSALSIVVAVGSSSAGSLLAHLPEEFADRCLQCLVAEAFGGARARAEGD